MQEETEHETEGKGMKRDGRTPQKEKRRERRKGARKRKGEEN